MFDLRKRQQKFQNLFDQCVALTDEAFSQLILSAYNERDLMKEGDILYEFDNTYMMYVEGKIPSCGNSWEGKKALYMALNLSDKHWVAVKVDLRACKLFVFDCNISAYTDSQIDIFMKPLCTMIPILLEQSEKFSNIRERLQSSWPFERLQGLPQNLRLVRIERSIFLFNFIYYY